MKLRKSFYELAKRAKDYQSDDPAILANILDRTTNICTFLPSADDAPLDEELAAIVGDQRIENDYNAFFDEIADKGVKTGDSGVQILVDYMGNNELYAWREFYEPAPRKFPEQALTLGNGQAVRFRNNLGINPQIDLEEYPIIKEKIREFGNTIISSLAPNQVMLGDLDLRLVTIASLTHPEAQKLFIKNPPGFHLDSGGCLSREETPFRIIIPLIGEETEFIAASHYQSVFRDCAAKLTGNEFNDVREKCLNDAAIAIIIRDPNALHLMPIKSLNIFSFAKSSWSTREMSKFRIVWKECMPCIEPRDLGKNRRHCG